MNVFVFFGCALTGSGEAFSCKVSAKINLMSSRNRGEARGKGVQRHGLGGPKSSAALPWAFQAVAEEVAPNGDGNLQTVENVMPKISRRRGSP